MQKKIGFFNYQVRSSLAIFYIEVDESTILTSFFVEFILFHYKRIICTVEKYY